MAGNDKKELEELLETVTPKVRNNVKIVLPEDIDQDFMHHIAIQKFKEMVPNISKRAASGEDNTLPRVHVCPTLVGCMQGYGSVNFHVYDSANTKTKANDVYKGYLNIYKIPFKACLKPGKRMVFDANETNEHWLVKYNSRTDTYPATIIGRLVPTSVTVTPVKDSDPIEDIGLVVEVFGKDNIVLDKKNTLKKGYWSIFVRDDKSKAKIECLDVQELAESVYRDIISTKIAMEGLSEDIFKKPAYSTW